MSAIQPQAYFKSIRQFKCSNCAGELSLINKRTRYVACQYCGTVQDAQSEAHQIITRLNAPSQFPPKSFIKLGMTAVFSGKKYQVLGRTRWRSKYKEYWSEEGETGYSDETWEYDEWVLMGEDFTYFYLIEDADGYAVSQSVFPKYPTLPKGTSAMNFMTGKQERVVEYGESKVVYFEGESTYQIKAGDRVQFSQYNSGRYSFIAEWRLKEDGKEIKEIEFFQEEPFSYKQILAAFANDPAIGQLKMQMEQRSRSKRFWRISFWLTALVFLVLLIGSAGEGEQVFTATYPVPVSNQNGASDDDDPEVLATTKPLALEKVNRVYEVKLSASMPDNSDVWTGLEILNEKGEVINAIEGDFFRASGDEYWEEDGESGVEHWEENETSHTAVYRLDEPGTYAARVFAMPSKIPNASVKLEVYEGSVLSRYYLIGFVIFTLLAVVSSVSASMAKAVYQKLQNN
jgi:hypothetical protein